MNKLMLQNMPVRERRLTMLFSNNTIPVGARKHVQLSRDVFARCDTIKRQIDNPPVDGCAWCGFMKRTPKSDRPFLYQYGTEFDSGKQFWNPRLFCQLSCFRSYES